MISLHLFVHKLSVLSSRSSAALSIVYILNFKQHPKARYFINARKYAILRPWYRDYLIKVQEEREKVFLRHD
jgi:hypothetical protein